MPLVGSFVMPHPPIAVPEVGKGEEAAIPATLRAFEDAAEIIAALRPDTIVLVSPHAMTYFDAFRIADVKRWKSNLESFNAPEARVDFPYDQELAEFLAETGRKSGFTTLLEDAGESEMRDHGSFVPLYFIQKSVPKSTKLVRLSFCGLDHARHVEFGRVLGKAFDERPERIVFVASGDLSHRLRTTGPYGLNRKAPIFENKVLSYLALGQLEKVAELDPERCDEVGECGIRSICMLAGIMEGRDYVPRLMSHEATFGVGYAIAAFLPPESMHKEVLTARFALESFVRDEQKKDEDRTVITPEDVPFISELKKQQAGAFVSLHMKPEKGQKEGPLRGCIGTISASKENLAEEIIAMAIAAGWEDPRFDEMEIDELPNLVYNVDVLGDPEPIEGPEFLDPKRYGVIVTDGMRRGLLLPDLPDVTSIRDQVAIAREKAGISADEDYRLERFEVKRYPDEIMIDENTVFPPLGEQDEN